MFTINLEDVVHFLGTIILGQGQLDSQRSGKGNGVHDEQSDIALDAAVAPDLPVDAAENPGGEHARKPDGGVEDNTI